MFTNLEPKEKLTGFVRHIVDHKDLRQGIKRCHELESKVTVLTLKDWDEFPEEAKNKVAELSGGDPIKAAACWQGIFEATIEEIRKQTLYHHKKLQAKQKLELEADRLYHQPFN